jgi:ectoine hydroxylase-related dioxygenase (phytanoyl-CoA dioxygenase family)
MTTTITRLSANDSAETVVAALEKDGAAIVEDLLNDDTLARFNSELDPLLESAAPDRKFINPLIDDFFGKHTRHVCAVAARSQTFAREVLCNRVMQQVADLVLLPNCANYQLNIAQVLDRGPGAELQYLHRDEDVWIHVPNPHPTLQIASVIALSDFTADNGATRLIPGSHRWPKDRVGEASETVAAEMSAGSAILYLGSTIHGGGPNVTSATQRRGMHMSYVVGWLRTEENNYLSVPAEIVRDLPKRSQELLGYAAHDAVESGGGYLGTVDLRNPIDLIAEGKL